ncbi:MAG: AMP-binding protein [Acidobacteriia bacterium]|nr:AMP-binding protein [Terriglobia bacterium]
MNKDQTAALKTSSFERHPAGLAREGDELLSFITAMRKKRLWIIEQLQSEKGGFHAPAAMKIRGQLDLQMIKDSLHSAVERHPQLSVLLGEADKGTAIRSAKAPSLPFIDLSSQADQQEQLHALLESEARHSSSLIDVPIRAVLVRMNGEEHWLILNLQQNTSSTCPIKDLLKDVEECYESLAKQDALPRERSQWQGEWSAEERDHLSYWKKQLESTPDVLELPSDQPQPGRPRAMHTFSLEAGTYVSLLNVSKREGVTLFMTLLAAFQTLLYRYTSQEDIVIGIAPLPAEHLEPEHPSGLFLSQMPLRVRIAGDTTLRQHLVQVREAVLEACKHRFCTNEELAEFVAAQPGFKRMSLSQIILVEEPESDDEPAKPQSCVVEHTTPGFDLKFSFQEKEGGLRGCMEYNPDLFEPATIRAMVERFQFLLDEITSNCDGRLSELHISKEEHHASTARWNGTPITHGTDRTICEMLAVHADSTPGALAVVADETSLSYGDLHRRSNQMAHVLRKNGVKTGDRVGVKLEQPIDVIVVTLGVLKAGAVVVWLDPSKPDARLRFISEDSGLVLVVTEERYGIPPRAVRTLYLDTTREELNEQPEQSLKIEAKEDMLACILYRSSPQGRPEGVLVPHRALWAGGWDRNWSVKANERVGLSINFNHDMACFEVFRLLASGACAVHLDQSLPPRKLVDLLREQQVAVWWTSASVLERVASDFPRALKNLRLILCDDQMGILYRLREALKPDVLERTFGIYGWTEAGGNCLLYPLAKISGPGRIDPAGHMAVGTELHVLDEKQLPVPEGVLGQVYIGSDALAMGYHKQPVRTASAFCASSLAPSRRLFRTGDWARCRADGTLEYRGRRDGRRVIGGLRVEVEEIEKLLLHHAMVLDAAVIPYELPGLRDAGLAALIVTADGQPITAEEIREFLKGHLPRVMLPQMVVRVDSIPRKKTGEVDRRALSRLAEKSEVNGASSSYVAPRTPMEEEMAGIWAQTLGMQRVGVHDNFFRIGGHSLLAAQTVARMSEAFGADIPMTRLFGAPSIAAMAKVVEELVQSGRKAITAST